MAKQDPAMYGVLNKPIGGDYLAGLQALMAKQGAQDEAARKQLETNKRMDLFKAMIAAGEATRGQRGGLGALAAGFGKSMIPALEARAQEAAAIEAAPIKREGLLIKAKYDIQELQRAQGNNDLKTVNAQKAKLFDTATKLYASGNAAMAREIAAIAGIREAEIRAAATEQAARIRAAAKGQGGAKPDRLTDQEQSVADYYAARIARGEKPGPETKARARDDHARGRAVASLEGTSVRMEELVNKQLKLDEIQEYAKLASMTPEQKEQWRADRRRQIIADIESGRYRLQRSPEAPTTAPAPGASSRPPPPPPGFYR
jgi:hypothetical protein